MSRNAIQSRPLSQTPTLNKRSINTTLSVDAGDIVLLGGLTQDTKTNNEEGLSFLPNFFAAKTADSQKSEIVMVLQITLGGAVSVPSHLVGVVPQVLPDRTVQ